MERAEEEISWIIVRKKKACIFSAKDIAKNVWKRAIPGRIKEQKGLIAKINANNLCQRKLF
jgi:hypothetical protein